jgi:Family of unknown function (DUF6011)
MDERVEVSARGVNTALDELKTKAETMVADAKMTKRPTWAPRIILGKDLLNLLFELEWLGGDDLAVARLWSVFTDPRRGEVQCEGFQLRAGEKHNGNKIWTAQYFDKPAVIANLYRQIEAAKSSSTLSFLEDALRITEAKTGGWSFGPHWISYRVKGVDVLAKVRQALELGHARVMDFAGHADEQMRAAGKYCGHCCCCGKALTDPISIELGIGPECRHKFHLSPAAAPGAWLIGGHDAQQ